VPERLVVTLADLERPQAGEIEGSPDKVGIVHPYFRRVVQATASHPLAIGFIHNHPDGTPPVPSRVDDEMDGYLAEYLTDFLPGRPFVSLILSTVDGLCAVSGRVFFGGIWTDIGRVAAERDPTLRAWPSGRCPAEPPMPPESVARMTSAFGREAFERLNRATVALIGAGGTGSAAIPILARAGLGKLVVIDGDHATISNLERLHGSRPSDIPAEIPKAAIARRAVAEFAPGVDVDAIVGRLPQDEVVDAVVQADLILGCTDQHSSRLAVADIATRYAIPAIDCGGLIEGADGIVTGQLVQIVRFLAADPCPRCRGMISDTRVAQEMLQTHVRVSNMAQADLAIAAGERPDPILTAVPQIDTVGYITTTAGTLAAGFAIGWLTGRFSPRFERLQLDLVSDCLGAVDRPQRRLPECSCGRIRGHADQGQAYAPITAPDHWPPVRRI
jgi:molybdopterin-synthase adenylyltransferase